MKAVQSSLDLFETQTNLEKGPRVAFNEVIAELRDPCTYLDISKGIIIFIETSYTNNIIVIVTLNSLSVNSIFYGSQTLIISREMVILCIFSV